MCTLAVELIRHLTPAPFDPGPLSICSALPTAHGIAVPLLLLCLLQGPGVVLVSWAALAALYATSAAVTSIWEPLVIIGSTAGGWEGTRVAVCVFRPSGRARVE